MVKKSLILCCIIFSAASLGFATNWYVRPAGGNYGSENGTNYANAWDGLLKVVWGSGGVKSGDTLWICGLHVHDMTSWNNLATQADISLVSGTGDTSRITLRGDHPGDPGIVWGAFRLSHEAWVFEGEGTWSITLRGSSFPDWFFQDITAASWVTLDKVGNVADCKSKPGSHYSPGYQSGDRLYIHCSDNGDPTGRIYGPSFGYHFRVDNRRYITFLNLKMYCPPRFIEIFDGQYADHISWEGCTLSYGEHSLLPFGDNCHYMEVIDCDLSWAGNGIYNISNTNNSPSYYLFKGNRIYNIGVRSTTRNSDAHAIGIQGGIGGTIEDNVCFKAGSGITLYAFTNQVLRNTTVRRNKIYDTHTLGGANSFGIETSCDNDSLSDKSGNLFYQNIIFNTSKGFKLQFEDTQEVYNNIIYNCQVGLFAARSYNGYGPSIKARNNIICNSGSNHIYYGTSGTTALLDSDHNLFYPDGPTKFWFNGAATNLAGWKSLSSAGFALDPNSGAVDPLFIAASNSNFHLQADSPATDTGTDVGLTKDIDGVSIPQGAGPDIGGYEFVFESRTLNASASASPASGSAPLNVAFTCTASGGASPYSYRWTFGDGGNSTIQNPSHTYSSIGSYSATVTVTDSTSATATSQVNINVTGAVPLSANIAASPTSGQAPLAVNFTGSTSGGTSPYSYRWSFGDGSNSTTQNPSHTYSSAGSFAATLTVTDSLSANASSTVAITVNSVLPQFTATATATPTSGQAPLAVSFTGVASGGTSPYSFNWDFGDGNSSTSQNPSYTYLSVGTYTATLTVTDSVSASANSSVSIIVGSTSSANLALAAQTGAPSPGDGGTTSPAPGTYNYAVGSDVDVSSIPNTNYRFSKWDGDISLTSAFDSATSLILDTSKSLTSTFCTMCADANGDLAITPADAQTAFDIFLGKIAQPTWCEKENADVNCSGTKLEPKVTPADAQMIFRKYIKKENLSGDCSGNSRTSAFPFETVGSFGSVGQVVLANVQAVRGDIIALPVFIDGLKEVTSFGFDLSFPSGSLTFMGLEKTDLTGDYAQLDGNVQADPAGPMDQDGQASEQESILRVGGFKLESNGSAASGVLVTLIFRAERDISEPQLLTVIALYDEIQNIMIPGSSPTLRSDRFDERQARDPENIDRGKRYDF